MTHPRRTVSIESEPIGSIDSCEYDVTGKRDDGNCSKLA